MKFVITKQGALFALMLIVALFAYIYITSPMLDFIKVFGCSLSLLLFLIAMQLWLCSPGDCVRGQKSSPGSGCSSGPARV